MKKVLIFSYEFYPTSSAAVTCLGKVIPFLSEKYEVTVFSSMHDKCEKIDSYYGARVFHMGTFFDRLIIRKERIIDYWLRYKNNYPLLRSLVLFLVKAMYYPATVLSEKYGYYYKESFIKNGLQNYGKLLEESDVFIASAAPHDNVDMAYRAKKMYPDKKLIFLLFDLFSYNPSIIDEVILKKRFETEKEWFKAADYIIMQPEMRSRLENTSLLGYASKLDTLPVPALSFRGSGCIDEVDENTSSGVTLDNKAKTLNSRNNKGIKLAYTGMFYEDIRHPEKMLNILSKVCAKDRDITVYIAGTGCEDTLRKYKGIMGESLVLLGSVSKEEADKLIRESDVLINLSNNVDSIVPSKIFEYIGELKPILNFYFIDSDVCKYYLKDYELSLSVKLDESLEGENYSEDNNLAEIADFIQKNYSERMEIDSVREKYYKYSADYYSQRILNEIG